MMFIPKKGIDDVKLKEVSFNKWLAAFLHSSLDIVAGIVGAAGAFLLVPIMLVVLKIPTRMTIASSLAIYIYIIHWINNWKDFHRASRIIVPAIIMVVASLIASPLGAKAGKKMNTKILQMILALLILGTAIKIWMDIL